jgi:hypothetical protein
MAMSAVSAAAATAAAVAVAPARECASSTSNAAFGTPSVRFAPAATRRMTPAPFKAVRASADASPSSQEPKAARMAMVGLLAAGAILGSGAVAAWAAGPSGPGGDGAAVTAKRADKLLKRADKLTKDDSPARFGEGLKNAGSTAAQAGSATASNVQDVADEAVKKARENLAKAKASFGNVIVSKDKVSDASVTKSPAS